MKVLSLVLSITGLLTISNVISYGQVIICEERREYFFSSDATYEARNDLDLSQYLRGRSVYDSLGRIIHIESFGQKSNMIPIRKIEYEYGPDSTTTNYYQEGKLVKQNFEIRGDSRRISYWQPSNQESLFVEDTLFQSDTLTIIKEVSVHGSDTTDITVKKYYKYGPGNKNEKVVIEVYDPRIDSEGKHRYESTRYFIWAVDSEYLSSYSEYVIARGDTTQIRTSIWSKDPQGTSEQVNYYSSNLPGSHFEKTKVISRSRQVEGSEYISSERYEWNEGGWQLKEENTYEYDFMKKLVMSRTKTDKELWIYYYEYQ